MKTYFASTERADNDEIQHQIEFASSNEIISGVLRVGTGLLAILNEHRQILAVNEAFLKELGITDAGDVLGLRPGETVGCVHASDMEAGCGTGKWCCTCGAAISIVSSLASEKPEERKCVLTVEKDGIEINLCFSVRSCFIRIETRRFILLYLQDITDTERRAALERVFLHDIKNLITAISCSAELIHRGNGSNNGKLVELIKRVSARLKVEIAVQTALAYNGDAAYQLQLEEISLESILSELHSLFMDRILSCNKKVTMPEAIPNITLKTDFCLLLRVLNNMLTNAFEATDQLGEVKLSVEQCEDSLTFHVWNRKHIPEDISRRIFQQYFSTKNEPGRGFGTYSMKLISEQFLGGTVCFSSSKSRGTVFQLTVPIQLP